MAWKELTILIGPAMVRRLLVGLIGIWGALAIVCVFGLGLGTDEAWVLNGFRSALEPPRDGVSSVLAGASGGLFAIVNLALEWLAGNRVWVHRLFSLACLFGMIAVVAARGRVVGGQSRGVAVLAIAPLLAVPGLAEIGTLAIGHSTALSLYFLFAWIWTGSRSIGMARQVVCGVLLGLAAASRLELALAFPAVVIAASSIPAAGRIRLRWPGWDTTVILVVAVSVLAASMFLMVKGIQPGIERQDAASYVSSKGVPIDIWIFFDYPTRLNRFVISQGFGPFVLLAAASLVPFAMARREHDAVDESGDAPASPRFEWLMIVTGWILWAGWLILAPIGHLRYLVPALSCFAAAAGSGLVWLATRRAPDRQPSGRSMACLVLAIGLVLGGIGGTFRGVVLGDHDYLSWEWSREMTVDYFRRFQALQDQWAAVDYVKALPDNTVAYTYGPPFILRYLADRPVEDLNDEIRLNALRGEKTTLKSPAVLILPPMIGMYATLSPKAQEWIRTRTRFDQEHGRWSFYTVNEPWPEDPTFLACARTPYVGHPSSTPWFGRHLVGHPALANRNTPRKQVNSPRQVTWK